MKNKNKPLVTISIPENKMRPVGGRIYVKEIDPKNVVTSSGIILPTTIDKGETSGGQPRLIKLRRYFVIDWDREIKIKGLCKGIEVFPFLTEEMIGVTYPFVIDWDNQAIKYTVMHESEICGIAFQKPVFTDYKLNLQQWTKKLLSRISHVFATKQTGHSAKQ